MVAPLIEDGWVTGATVTDEDGADPRGPGPVRRRGGRRFQPVRLARGGGARPFQPVAIAARRYYRDRRPQAPVLESWLNLVDPTEKRTKGSWPATAGSSRSATAC